MATLVNLGRRNIPTSALAASLFGARRNVSIGSLLHGSPEAKKDGDLEVLQHSRIVARGKYIHGFEVHKVKPGSTDAYVKAAEKYYSGLVKDERLKVKLTGNWETIVGEQDTFYHVLEYENYHGYDNTVALLRSGSEHMQAHKDMLPHLNSRTSQLCQEFSFFPTAPPHSEGGIFELRSYQLKPGSLLEWENTWRVGINARRKFVEPVGAWFSQVGRLHQVHHLWQYKDLATRKETREKAWQLDGWADTVSKTAQLCTTMDSFILQPLSVSPLK